MAIALARQGVPAAVLDRREGPDRHPRAHVCNPRTLELFRLWGVEERVRAAGLPAAALGSFTWRTAIAGEELGQISYAGHAEEHVSVRANATLCPEVSCAQDVVEAILRERLFELTGNEVRYGAEVEAVSQPRPGEVEVDVAGGKDPIRSRYVIAADGAGSRTRQRLGIGMEGPRELARFVAMHLSVDLSPWVGDRPAVLYWVVNSRVQGVFISMDGHSRYTFHVRADSAGMELEDPSIEECEALVRAAVGSEEVEPEIREVGHWVMSGQVARHYRAGNVFLAGDAAHRFPPTGGFGMNTGVQDAHNLAWKLAAVLDGWAPESLLESYEAERKPVAELFCRRSVDNFLRLERIASWSPDPAPVLARLEAGGSVAVAERRRFREEIEHQRDHFDKLALELGFAYPRGALVPEGDEPIEQPDGRHPYRPEAHPGARAPLARLTRPGGGEAWTTDLFETGFVLLADADQGWAEATGAVASRGVPIGCLEIGRDLFDEDGEWARTYGVRAGGAVLVRPDGHVALRCSERPTNPTATLLEAFEQIRGGASTN
jgi:2-polyprenyl-6-methoxyphenol hydroxylase-like FAD-dependent oxidoreductase